MAGVSNEYIDVRSLTKFYGDKPALDGVISLHVMVILLGYWAQMELGSQP